MYSVNNQSDFEAQLDELITLATENNTVDNEQIIRLLNGYSNDVKDGFYD